MDLGLTGKVALVAGASRGLGRAVAETLAAEGARVSISSRDESAIAAVAREIEAKHGSRVSARAVDVTEASQVNDWVERVTDEHGRIDVLVANAGGPPASRFESTDADAFRAGLELNLLSTVHMCHAVVPTMKAQRSGRIVAIMSISIKQPVDGLILSNTSRAGVNGLMKTLANELGPHGIGVNVVCPGYTRTDRLVELASRLSANEGVPEEAIYKRWTDGIPMGRIGEPEEFASVVAFLCSERASYVTGTCLQVDGGAVRSVF